MGNIRLLELSYLSNDKAWVLHWTTGENTGRDISVHTDYSLETAPTAVAERFGKTDTN